MKKLILTLALIFTTSIVSADSLTTTSSDTYTKGIEKEIRLTLPQNCSAFQGDIVLANADLVSVSEDYADKELYFNPANNRFLIYGINKTQMEGENLIIKIIIDSNSEAIICIADPLGATPDAEPIAVDTFSMDLHSINDIDGDGDLDVDDVTALISQVFDGDATVQDIQKIINAVLEEL